MKNLDPAARTVVRDGEDVSLTPDAAGSAKPAGAAGAPGTDTANDEEADKDPYEGIPEEELPPDLQYSADSSVSFPTNI